MLSGGARLVAVWNKSGLKTMALWRFQKEVGLIEERTFMQKCGVPEYATRAPLYGQYKRPAADGGGEWFCVTYLWFGEGHQHGTDSGGAGDGGR